MRRGGMPKELPAPKKPAIQLTEVKAIEKRSSVMAVLQYFKSGKRDVKEAYLILKAEEEVDESAITAALE